MKKQVTILSVIALAFGLGFTTSNFATSAGYNSIAVVNVDKVLSASGQVTALKKDQQKKALDLQNWVKNAQADVNKQTTPQAKKNLKEKYDKELAAKRSANNKDFSSRLSVIEKNVTDTISQYAKSKGYSVVLAKNVVIYGGDDITEEVSKIVK